jgi:hypothetical protein
VCKVTYSHFMVYIFIILLFAIFRTCYIIYRHSSPFINVVKGVFFVVRVTLVPVSYLSAPSAVHSYRVPGKFIRRLNCLFVVWKVYSSSKLAEGSLFCLFLKLVQINCIFTDNVRILYIYWYILYNFWKYLFVKIAARVLAPDHIVTSLEHILYIPTAKSSVRKAIQYYSLC